MTKTSSPARPVGLAKGVQLRCLRVFVDQPAEDLASLDLGGRWGSDLRTRLGWLLAERAMWPMVVVVRGVGCEGCRQVPFADDEHPVGAFPAGGVDPAFGEGVGAGCLWRRLDDLDVGCGEYGVEDGGELGVAVA